MKKIISFFVIASICISQTNLIGMHSEPVRTERNVVEQVELRATEPEEFDHPTRDPLIRYVLIFGCTACLGLTAMVSLSILYLIGNTNQPPYLET